MSRTRGRALLAAALLGSTLAGAAFFYGKRLRSEDLKRDQEYKLGRRNLVRGLAILMPWESS